MDPMCFPAGSKTSVPSTRLLSMSEELPVRFDVLRM
jgi:hypothetical protein